MHAFLDLKNSSEFSPKKSSETNWKPKIQRACLPEEYDWAVQGGGEVEGCVGVSFASGALAKVADHDFSILGTLEGVSAADSCKISENLSEPWKDLSQ